MRKAERYESLPKFSTVLVRFGCKCEGQICCRSKISIQTAVQRMPIIFLRSYVYCLIDLSVKGSKQVG